MPAPFALPGVDVTTKRAAERGVGFVFQHYALFRHLNVFENVAFGLRVQPSRVRPSKRAISRAGASSCCSSCSSRRWPSGIPSQLSGGQRQRVALARALAVEPKILLLDEPFGALDARVRKDLRRWLRSLHQRLHVTTLFVTHDQEEALELSDRVVIMHQGRVEQVGTPEEVYHSPATPFVVAVPGRREPVPLPDRERPHVPRRAGPRSARAIVRTRERRRSSSSGRTCWTSVSAGPTRASSARRC